MQHLLVARTASWVAPTPTAGQSDRFAQTEIMTQANKLCWLDTFALLQGKVSVWLLVLCVDDNLGISQLHGAAAGLPGKGTAFPCPICTRLVYKTGQAAVC